MVFAIDFQKVSSSVCEPFYEGVKMLEFAWHGKQVKLMRARTWLTEDLGSVERVAHVALGLLLLVPIVNMVVLAILKHLNGPDVLNSSCSSGRKTADFVRYTPVTERSASPEEYVKRKREALDQLSFEENGKYVCRKEVLEFDLDNALAPYQNYHDPILLLDLLDAFLLDLLDSSEQNSVREQLRTALVKYSQGGLAPSEQSAKEKMSRLYHFFLLRFTDSGALNNLEGWKERFKEVVRGLIDAHKDCVDQINSQLEEMLVLEIGCFSAGQSTQLLSPMQRLISIAGNEILKHKAALIKTICLQEYPSEQHAADLERAVKDSLANFVGLKGKTFTGQAIINFKDLDQKVNHIGEIFMLGEPSLKDHCPNPQDVGYLRDPNQYMNQVALRRHANKFDPEEYLLENIRIHNGVDECLRRDLMIWAKSYFNFEANDDLTREFLETISEDANNTIDEGGNLTPEATLWLLKKVGILVKCSD